MKQINVITNNGSRIVRVDDDANVEAILTSQEVQQWIDEDAEDILESFAEYNGIEVSPAIHDALLSACPGDNDTITLDIDSNEDEGGNEAGTGAPGRVTVCTSGGLQSTVIDIMDGETTLRAAIYNDRVRGRSGMTDTQLSACSVMLNGNDVPANALENTILHDGDTITLNARAASIKG